MNYGLCDFDLPQAQAEQQGEMMRKRLEEKRQQREAGLAAVTAKEKVDEPHKAWDEPSKAWEEPVPKEGRKAQDSAGQEFRGHWGEPAGQPLAIAQQPDATAVIKEGEAL